MKKITLGLIALSLLLLPFITFAVDNGLPPTNQVINLPFLIDKIELVIWMVFGLIAVIAFIYAAILFLTAGGQPEKVQAARSAFLWGVAGVIVGILAFSIVEIVKNFL